jgi:hypothetical protein
VKHVKPAASRADSASSTCWQPDFAAPPASGAFATMRPEPSATIVS